MKNCNCFGIKGFGRCRPSQSFKGLILFLLVFCSNTVWGATPPPPVGASPNAPSGLNPTASVVITNDTNQVSNDLYQPSTNSSTTQATALLSTHLNYFCAPADTVQSFNNTTVICSGSQNVLNNLAHADLRLSNILSQLFIPQGTQPNSFYSAALNFISNLIQPFPTVTNFGSGGIPSFFSGLTSSSTGPVPFAQTFTPETANSVARYPFEEMLAKRSTAMPSFTNAQLTNSKWSPQSIIELMEKYSYLWFQNSDWNTTMATAWTNTTTTSTTLPGVGTITSPKTSFSQNDYMVMTLVSIAQMQAFQSYMAYQQFRQMELANALLGTMISVSASQARLINNTLSSVPTVTSTTGPAPAPSTNTPPALPAPTPAPTPGSTNTPTPAPTPAP